MPISARRRREIVRGRSCAAAVWRARPLLAHAMRGADFTFNYDDLVRDEDGVLTEI
jgi:hypothetical protein